MISLLLLPAFYKQTILIYEKYLTHTCIMRRIWLCNSGPQPPWQSACVFSHSKCTLTHSKWRIPVPKPQRWGRNDISLTWGKDLEAVVGLKGGFPEPAGSQLPELVCLLWCPATALGVVGHNWERQKSILSWGRKGDISKVGTSWFNRSLEAHIKKHGKNDPRVNYF